MNIHSFYRFSHRKISYINTFNEAYSSFCIEYKNGVIDVDFHIKHIGSNDFLVITRYNFHVSWYLIHLANKGIKFKDVTRIGAMKDDIPMDYKTSRKIFRFVKKRYLKQFYIMTCGLKSGIDNISISLFKFLFQTIDKKNKICYDYL